MSPHNGFVQPPAIACRYCGLSPTYCTCDRFLDARVALYLQCVRGRADKGSEILLRTVAGSNPAGRSIQQPNSRVGEATSRAVSRQTGAPRLRPSARGGYDQHIGNGGMLATLQSRTVIQSRMDPASHGAPSLDPFAFSQSERRP